MAEYVPLHLRDDPEALTEWRQLRLSVSESLAAALAEWISPFVCEKYGADTALGRKMALIFELSSPLGGAGDAVRLAVALGQPEALSCIDYVLSHESSQFDPLDPANPVDALRHLLDLARSAWTVTQDAKSGLYRLERRDMSQTQEVVGDLVRRTDRPGLHLASAWKAVAGISPSPNEAYNQAVCAVEAAYAPVVIPRDKGARLGKIQRAIEAKPDKWTFSLRVLNEVDEETPAGTLVVAEMMRVLARANVRHGVHEQAQHSEDEALAAVHLAVSLVGFVASGAFRATRPDA